MSEARASADVTARVEELVGRKLHRAPRVLTDTTSYMSIDRDDVIDLQGELFVVRGNEREGRFTIDDQPKFWVKRALSLETGATHILKLSFREAFKCRIGELEVRCARSGDKESEVLARMAGDWRFMQGRTVRDAQDNNVRVIDFIFGSDLLAHLEQIALDHAAYFEQRFPTVLAHVMECFRAIEALHALGLCHGDIRNDHIFVEKATGRYRWIDFDLTQDFPDFDVWSAGNILHWVVAKGFVTFRDLKRGNPAAFSRLTKEDGSLFFPHRVMALGKVYDYLPDELNRILERFSVGTVEPYETMRELLTELEACATARKWPLGPEGVATGTDAT